MPRQPGWEPLGSKSLNLNYNGVMKSHNFANTFLLASLIDKTNIFSRTVVFHAIKLKIGLETICVYKVICVYTNSFLQ